MSSAQRHIDPLSAKRPDHRRACSLHDWPANGSLPITAVPTAVRPTPAAPMAPAMATPVIYLNQTGVSGGSPLWKRRDGGGLGSRNGRQRQRRHRECKNSLSHLSSSLDAKQIFEVTAAHRQQAAAIRTRITNRMVSQLAALQFDRVVPSCDQINCWVTVT
jgi:hypothetical protein